MNLYPLDTILVVIKATPRLDLPQIVQLPLCYFLLGSLTNSGQCYIPGVRVLNTWVEDKLMFILLHLNIDRRGNLSITVCAKISVSEPDNMLKKLLSLQN